jgi:hypothetical protein
MIKKSKSAALTLIVFASFSIIVVPAQNRESENRPECPGPTYSSKQVTKPAKMIDQPNFKALYEAFGNDVSGRVRLEAIFCRSGRVTDIRVADSQPPKIGEFVAAAVSLVRFRPAELNWHTVSQRMQFEFSINESGVSEIDAAAAAGRRIEELGVMGNRRMTAKQILAMTKTRAGDLYNAEQVQRDLSAILATGYFNGSGTRVLLHDGVRGGVRVWFEVFELPLITEIKFEGLKDVDQSAMLEELLKQKVNLRKGAPLDITSLKAATQVIEMFLRSKGWRALEVEKVIENVSATEVAITFKITAYKVGS